MRELDIVKQLADDELVLRVAHYVREDRRVSAALLVHLNELDERGLYRDLGYESLFQYAVQELHMSESEAGLRIYAAKFARRFPSALEMLGRGELHLTAMRMLSPVLTDENVELLKLACHKSKPELQLLIAKYCPQSDVPELVRRLPEARRAMSTREHGLRRGAPAATPASAAAAAPAATPKPAPAPGPTATPAHAAAPARAAAPAHAAAPAAVPRPSPAPSPTATPTPAATSTPAASPSTAASLSPPAPSAAATPAPAAGSAQVAAPSSLAAMPATAVLPRAGSMPSLAATPTRIPALAVSTSNSAPATPIREGRYKIQFTAGQRVRDLIQEAQDLYRNQLPDGDIAVILERALDMLVTARKKELYAHTDKPRDQKVVATQSAHESATRSRHIPNEVKRAVFARDRGQCRFVGKNGARCCGRSRLEFHHVHAFGRGGPATTSNIMLLCRAHNQLLAERDYSREHIKRCIRARRDERTAHGSERQYISARSGADGSTTVDHREEIGSKNSVRHGRKQALQPDGAAVPLSVGLPEPGREGSRLAPLIRDGAWNRHVDRPAHEIARCRGYVRRAAGSASPMRNCSVLDD